MDDWRQHLYRVVSGWNLSPEDQAAIAEELEAHLEEQLEELTPRIGAAAARERILAQIADPTLRDARVRPRHRAAPSVEASRRNGVGWDGVLRDFTYGWRSLSRSPGTTVLATVALALGIGLTTVMFSIIYGTLMRGLPFDDGNRIAIVERSAAVDGRDETLPMHEFFAFRDAQHSFDAFGAYLPSTVNLSGDERPERVATTRITAGAMEIPKVRPLLGRVVQRADEDPASELVVVLSHAIWRDRYASDSAVIGRKLRVNGLPATIVGVMPDGFEFPLESKIWIPLRLNASLPWGTGPSVNGIGRLRAGLSFDQANAELARIALRIDAEHHRPEYTVKAIAQPFVRAVLRTQVYTLLYTMFAAVSLVFLVACMNVANLLLARATQRSREIAVRRALGASRVAIVRQFLVEAFVLSLLAAAVGALLAKLGIALFTHATAAQFPFFTDIRLHPQVFAFIAIAAFLASILAGLFPAIVASGARVTDTLKDQSLGSSSWRGRRLSRVVVVLELTLSAALLIVAALATKSMLNLRSVEPHFRTSNVLAARVTLTSRDTIRNAAFFARLDDELTRLPGASAATLISGLPGTGWGETPVSVDGQPPTRRGRVRSARHLAVTAGFFKTFDVTPIRGRAITPEDRRGSLPVAVVNQRFVRDLFANTDPIGHRINLSENDTLPRWATIVGVIPDLYAISTQDPWPAEVITALRQETNASASIAIHSDGDPTTLTEPLRTLVASFDRDLPIYSVTTMKESMAESSWPARVFGGLFAVFAVVALALASIGLYSVLAFAVRQRERELGIRMALGAAAGDVIRLVLRDGFAQLALGIPIGLALGIAAAKAARAMLFGVQPTDALVVGVVVATLVVSGMIACVAPALRAAKADPLRSLRAE
jgi:predicted permease